MKVVDRKVVIGSVPQFICEDMEESTIELAQDSDEVKLYKITIGPKDFSKKHQITWRIAADSVKGVWTSNSLLDKRIRADWEIPQVSSRVSVDAPVISAFSHLDTNVISVACSDTVNQVDFELSYREEDDSLYCRISFKLDSFHPGAYHVFIREDKRSIPFSKAIQGQAKWLEDSLSGEIASVPESAKLPLYSTWYSYHQDFTIDQLLEECRISKSLGYDVIIVDDGWQTLDDNRGYDYTGDWRPERIPNMKAFSEAVHSLGMKLMLWYSVPFCGKKSQAYQDFKGKFLTEKHPWAPVFDIRFPEVRDHLRQCYVEAIKAWEVDGLKLDFIDDFRIYPETEMKELNGRDTLSVNQGVEKLILELREDLFEINPDLLIEFRQKYISPRLRILGNMFRAFDCPFDSLMNRVRTTDVKLLCGKSAVHSDMITWPMNVSVEEAALQFTSILFSVPQLSIRLGKAGREHLKMIEFYTAYWRKNEEILLGQNFIVKKPLSNYPIIQAQNDLKQIIGLYDDLVLKIDATYPKIDIINGKMSESVVLEIRKESNWQVSTFDCMGNRIKDYCICGSQEVELIKVRPNGLIKLIKV